MTCVMQHKHDESEVLRDLCCKLRLLTQKRRNVSKYLLLLKASFKTSFCESGAPKAVSTKHSSKKGRILQPERYLSKVFGLLTPTNFTRNPAEKDVMGNNTDQFIRKESL